MMNKWKIISGIAGALILLYLLIGSIATSQIESQVFKHTGVPLKITAIDLSLFSGTIAVSGIAIQNPEGFNTYNNAFSLENIRLAVSLGSLFSDTIHVKELRVVAPRVYIEKTNNQINLKALADNVKRNAPKAEPKTATADNVNANESTLKLIVDHLSIEQIALTVGKNLVPGGEAREYPINDIVLENIGTSTNGADIASISGIVIQKIQENAGDLPRRIMLSSMGDIGKKLMTQPIGALIGGSKILLGTTGDAAKKVLEAPTAVIDSVKDAPGAVFDGVKTGTEALGDLLPFGSNKKE